MDTHELCLVCSKHQERGVGNEVEANASSSFNVYFEQDNCLNAQLIPIFVLRNLLQFPSVECEQLLTLTHGISNPASWFVLCSNCTQHVRIAFDVYQKILKLNSKFDNVCQILKSLLGNDLIEETASSKPVIKREEDIVNVRQVIRRYFRESSQVNRDLQLQDGEWPNLESYPDDVCTITSTSDRNNEERYVFENIENPSSSPPSPLWTPVESFSDNDPESEGSEVKNCHIKKRTRRNRKKVKSKKSTNSSSQNQTRVHGRTKCKICKNDYSTESIRKHLKRHVLYKRTTCKECSYPARNESILNLHMQREHPEEYSKQLQLATPNRIVDEGQSKKEIPSDTERDEKLVSTNQKEYSRVICHICKNDYSTESIRKHLRRHKLYKETTCKECSFPARNQTVLDVHMEREHNGGKESVEMTPSSSSHQREAVTTEHILESDTKTKSTKRKRNPVVYKYSDNDEDMDVDNVEAPTSPLWNPGGEECDNESNSGNEDKNQKELSLKKEITTDAPLKETKSRTISMKEKCTRVTCTICKNDYSTESIRKHLYRHRMYKDTTCKECHFPAKNQLQLDYHIRRLHTPQGKIKSITSSSNDQVKKIRKRYRKYGLVKCKICKFEYSHNSILQHMDRHQWYKNTSCSICKFPTMDNTKLVAHLRRYHPDSPELTSLETLIANSKPTEINICELCGFIASTKHNYYQHKLNHQIYDHITKCPTTDNLICKHCSKSFDTVNKVRRHLRDNHEAEVSKGAFHCKLCDSWYFTKGSLQMHDQTVHKNQLRYYCEQCGKGFLNQRRFEDHQASHLYTPGGKGHIICDNCGLDFKSQISLKQHQKKFHETSNKQVSIKGEFPRNPDEPELGTSTQVTRPQKNKNTSSVTQYKCTQCGVACINSRALKVHLKDMHKELYIYKCDMCEASYMRLPSLRIHQSASHSQNKAVCPYCDKEFGCSQYLQQHLKSCKNNTSLN